MSKVDLNNMLDALKSLNPDQYDQLIDGFTVFTKELLKNELNNTPLSSLKQDAFNILADNNLMGKFRISNKGLVSNFIGYPDSFSVLEEMIADPENPMPEIVRID